MKIKPLDLKVELNIFENWIKGLDRRLTDLGLSKKTINGRIDYRYINTVPVTLSSNNGACEIILRDSNKNPNIDSEYKLVQFILDHMEYHKVINKGDAEDYFDSNRDKEVTYRINLK